MADEIKLLGFWRSPFVQRIRLALELKGLQYEYLEEDIHHGKSQLLLDSNPVHKKVPVLIHNGKPICESLVIFQYIEETWPNNGVALLPQDPYEKALARFWVDVIDNKVLTALKTMISTVEEKKKKGIELLHDAYLHLESALNGKTYFGGDEVGLVDMAFAPYINWLCASKDIDGSNLLPEEDKYPHLASWVEVVMDHPAMKKILPHLERILEYARSSTNL